MSIFESFEMIDDHIVNNQWVECYHYGIPNDNGIIRETIRLLMLVLGHCLVCTKLDGCYFLEKKMPKLPLHDRCDCSKIDKPTSHVKSVLSLECDIRKFTEYIFKGAGGKKELFESWGYSVHDSYLLQNEFQKQAKEQFLKGNYELKNLDRSKVKENEIHR